ncbi:NAD(P) transhydrogenase subunit alpha part 2 [Candidatus Trichorickettsia mobilis]|jgi:NAD(P) transhydrogenase subunit alpha|uniref:proton-translocating NAD(P)(+) transhydrogenase n=1 Tax=Candidatus Trichorickettsia mobilis TaxID=1346319 RepID=A0ABZ0UV82_9RICK|nr:NAD(P) transhydrogenase subunit alpha [Candidatus Trichorickettsia mobilis]WPY01090.1 NAD(P) transhydrogenase subunit alpha part 2 [Candidatus Trichorickettsia mobilis]
MSQLPIAVKQASSIAEQAQNLSDILKDIALQGSDQINVGVDPFVFAITIFILACFVGYYVVWKVTPALHTPLMSITNAISGIIIIGGMIAASPEGFSLSSVCGYFAAFLAAINIFGGFIVTERMLEMFKKK